MLDNQTINRLSDKINQLLPPELRQVKSDFDTRLKSLLHNLQSHYLFIEDLRLKIDDWESAGHSPRIRGKASCHATPNLQS